MAIDPNMLVVLKDGSSFERIQLIDNFYAQIDIEKESETSLLRVLTLFLNSDNDYIKRSAFKIQCDLTLVGRIQNRFSTLTIIQNYLTSDAEQLQIIALKYYPRFQELQPLENVIERLKQLSDSSNADVASQAFLCLGINDLVSNIRDEEIVNLIANLSNTRLHFQAAEAAIENRVDAEFYLLIIEWIIAIAGKNLVSVSTMFNEIERNLKCRELYALNEVDLEIDFLVFQFLKQLKLSFEILMKSCEWLDFRKSIEELLEIKLEIQTIKSLNFPNSNIVQSSWHRVFEIVDRSSYRIYLSSERKRLSALKISTENEDLIEFIDNILSHLGATDEVESENLELLAMLTESQGAEVGLEIYNGISKKSASLEEIQAIRQILEKNKNSQLPFRTGSIYGRDVLNSLMNEINSKLPDLPSNKIEAFSHVLEEVIRYTRATQVGNDKGRFLFLYSETENGKGQNAVEQDLQDSMYSFFEHSRIADGLDHEKSKFVDGGRVDIVYSKDLITIPIELKKSLQAPDKSTLEQNYIAQAQTYTSGYDQLGIFVVMELSDKSTVPPPNFKDWFNIHHLATSSNLLGKYPDYVVSVVIPGNRTTPSKKSVYK